MEVQMSIYQPPVKKKWAKGGKHARAGKHFGKRTFKAEKRKKYALTKEERADRKNRCEDCGWDKPTEMYSVMGVKLVRPRLCTRCYERQVRRAR